MLHGEIKVNDGEIAKWRAVRKEELFNHSDAGKTFLYECHLEYRNRAGYPMEAAFVVAHAFGDGAVILASKVLLQGYAKLRVKPMGRDIEAVTEIARRVT